MENLQQFNVAILGGGNIGTAMAKGFALSGKISPGNIIITRRKTHLLEKLSGEGFIVQTDNRDAVKKSKIVILAVPPQQLNGLLDEIKSDLNPDFHVIVSVVSGVNINEIINHIGKNIPVVRVMPTLGAAIRESMTCIASKDNSKEVTGLVECVFSSVGQTLLVDEEQIVPATALCACGIAFFLRAIRAASQGGIEIGFHSEDAIIMAAQTAKGAASLLLDSKNHPETEIDKVTTPEGCTISGLNEMEFQGFSSAMIKGIITSSEKAAKLYNSNTK